MSYYNSYGHQLPLASTVGPPSSSNNSIKSESGVRSPTGQHLATSQTTNILPHVGNNSTIHPPNNSSADPTNYHPTPNVSSTLEDLTFGVYNKEIAGLCNSISKFTQEIPSIDEQGRNVPITMIGAATISENPMFNPNQRMTPVKFSIPHVKAVFSARGVLAKVDAKSPLDGQSGNILNATLLFKIHDISDYSGHSSVYHNNYFYLFIFMMKRYSHRGGSCPQIDIKCDARFYGASWVSWAFGTWSNS